MAIAEAEWTIVHGDSARSPAFAVCTTKGDSVDLESGGWVVRAQARETLDSYDLIYGWSAGHGIELSTGKVELSNGRTVVTSTVALTLLPGDFAGLPRDWSGIVEIEAASDSTSSPAERYSIARLRATIIPDVTRDEGTLIVSPGIPAPSAPAGGVLAGSYPNPIFAVPMMGKAEIESAIAEASVADRQRGNHVGTQSADTLTDGSTKRAFLAAERDKLAGVAVGATANATDTQLRDRATHTGSMSAAAVSDFAETVQDVMGGSFVEGLNISIAYNDADGTFTIAAPNSGTGAGGSGGISGVRTTNGSGNSFTGEVLRVDASSGPVTINPPPGAPALTQITVVKVDSSSNHVTWSGPTNGASSYDIASRWSGAQFTYNGSVWTVTAVSAAALTYADITGVVPDASIPSLIARDQEVTDAIVAAQAGNRARTNHTGTQPISTVSGLQTALDAREPVLTQTTTKTSNYTAAANEAVPLDTSGSSITLTFPTGAPVGTHVGARWVAGTASPFIAAPTGETIGTAQTVNLLLPPAASSGELVVYQKYSSTVWLPAKGFKPQSALDAYYESRFDTRYPKLIARAARTTNALNSVNGAEQRVLGLNAVSLTAGRLYRLTAVAQIYGGSANGFGVAKIRYTTDGTIPTTSSTQLTESVVGLQLAGTGYSVPQVIGYYSPVSDGSIRPTLSYLGPSTMTITMQGNVSGPIQLAVEDLGIAPALSGTTY